MNPTQLKAFSNTKPDVRQLLDETIDYLLTNPGGGGVTIYTGDGQLASDRTVDLNGKYIKFNAVGVGDLLSMDPVIFTSSISADDGTGSSARIDLIGDSGSNIFFDLSAAHNDDPVVEIKGTAVANTLEYTADTHTFNGDTVISNLAGGGVTGLSIDNDGKIIRTP